MKKQIVFEGFYDEDPGWEFDMPVWTMKPYKLYDCNANSSGQGIWSSIEEYFIALSMGEILTDDECCNNKATKSMFTRAKNGHSRESVKYWKCVVEYDDETIEDEMDFNIIEAINYKID